MTILGPLINTSPFSFFGKLNPWIAALAQAFD
jgi:hypothetical protein